MTGKRMSKAEAVAALEAIDPSGDPEGAHGEADRILLAIVGAEVAAAYAAVVERAPWWA